MGIAKKLRKAVLNEQARRRGHYQFKFDPTTLGYTGGSPIGAGMRRAARRAAEQAKRNAATPSAARYTRQQRRADERKAQ